MDCLGKQNDGTQDKPWKTWEKQRTIQGQVKAIEQDIPCNLNEKLYNKKYRHWF